MKVFHVGIIKGLDADFGGCYDNDGKSFGEFLSHGFIHEAACDARHEDVQDDKIRFEPPHLFHGLVSPGQDG